MSDNQIREHWTDEYPSPLPDDLLRSVAETPGNWSRPMARELIAARERISELEAVADRNSKLYIKAAPQLAEARGWAAWFAAERDYVNRHRREELAINRAYMDRMAVDMDAKAARIAELEAFVADLAENGLRFDLTPTMNLADVEILYAGFADYLHRIDSAISDRARALIGGDDE
jgi:hypothetical protein